MRPWLDMVERRSLFCFFARMVPFPGLSQNFSEDRDGRGESTLCEESIFILSLQKSPLQPKVRYKGVRYRPSKIHRILLFGPRDFRKSTFQPNVRYTPGTLCRCSTVDLILILCITMVKEFLSFSAASCVQNVCSYPNPTQQKNLIITHCL